MNQHLKKIVENREVDLGDPDLFVVHAPDYSWLKIKSSSLPMEFNSGRKWLVSPYACKSEVVQTIFAALLAWYEHEAREQFKYRGQAIFGPHFDVDALHAIASDGAFEYREAS